jgi:hypothetical protein
VPEIYRTVSEEVFSETRIPDLEYPYADYHYSDR